MERKFVNKNFLNGYKPMIDNGNESYRFYNDEYMLKFINKKYLKEDREQIINELERLNHKNIVTPEFTLYDRKGFLGYAMKYYKGYGYICEKIDNTFTNNPSTTFDYRKNLMLELSDTFDYFNRNDFAYFDLHGQNILVKDNDIKVIDLDGGIFKGYKNRFDYDDVYLIGRKKQAQFILGYLLNLNPFGIEYTIRSLKSKGMLDIAKALPTSIRDLFVYISNNDYHAFNNITNTIYDFTEPMYEETTYELKKRITL